MNDHSEYSNKSAFQVFIKAVDVRYSVDFSFIISSFTHS